MKHLVLLLLISLPSPALAGTAPIKLSNDNAKAIVTAGPSEAIVAVVMGHEKFSDPATLVWQRYDVAAGKLIPASRGDTTVPGFTLTYKGSAQSSKLPPEVAYVGSVPPGDYVLVGHMTGDGKTSSFCFGAPVMHIEAGSVAYLGSYRKMSNNYGYQERSHKFALAWEGDIDKARETLRHTFPALADRLVSVIIHNGATFECSGERMWAYGIPGAPVLRLKKTE